jgi:hypothetical protein
MNGATHLFPLYDLKACIWKNLPFLVGTTLNVLQIFSRMNSGFRRGVYETFALLRCDAE